MLRTKPIGETTLNLMKILSWTSYIQNNLHLKVRLVFNSHSEYCRRWHLEHILKVEVYTKTNDLWAIPNHDQWIALCRKSHVFGPGALTVYHNVDMMQHKTATSRWGQLKGEESCPTVWHLERRHCSSPHKALLYTIYTISGVAITQPPQYRVQ